MELALEWGHVWQKDMKKEERKGNKNKQKKTLKPITNEELIPKPVLFSIGKSFRNNFHG
ncbi:MAG: hypothetical protein WB014_14050 [Methanosarcina sp.]